VFADRTGPPVLWESVPNFSEGRDRRTIDALTGEDALDEHADALHHRCVVTLADADPERLLDGLLTRVGLAVEQIDLRTHEGLHPRLGAADVLPIVPLGAAAMAAAEELARELAEEVWRRHRVPVYFYGSLAGGRRLAELRQTHATVPFDVGDRVHPTAGACCVGARRPLVAVNLAFPLPRARVSAALPAMRALPGVQALTFPARGGLVQLSMNLTRPDEAGVSRVVVEAERLLGMRSVLELVGLCPAAAAGPRCDGGLLEGRLGAAGARAGGARLRAIAGGPDSGNELRRLGEHMAARERPLAETRAEPEAMLRSAEEAVALLRLLQAVPDAGDSRTVALLGVAARGLRAALDDPKGGRLADRVRLLDHWLRVV
jgi:glutamate formiminotransferase